MSVCVSLPDIVNNRFANAAGVCLIQIAA
jgi:hypothetical protein